MSKNEPWTWLVQIVVTTLTTAPALRPYSASKFEATRSSAMASMGRMVAGVPNTPASLMAGSLREPSFMSVPSGGELLARPRGPLAEEMANEPGGAANLAGGGRKPGTRENSVL